MKKTFSRIVAFAIAFVMLLGVVPVSVFAAEEKPIVITVSSQTGCPGDTVQVKVSLDNNTGLTGLQLDIAYDEMLLLTNVEINSNFGGAMIETSNPYKNPQTLTMISPLVENTTNGILATFSFTIAEDAPNNYNANIVVTPTEAYNESGDIALTVINGSITVYHGLPGDINEDSKVDTKDAIFLFRYVAGWDVDVDTAALDVNGDNKITTKDAVTLFRYAAGWEDIILYYGEVCTHDLIHSVAKETTCTEDGQIEFWYCELCGRIYSDEACNTQISRQDTIVPATGHNTVIDEAVSATHTSTGLTQGSHCDICGTVLVEQQVIPVIPGTNYGITYDLFGGDTYLATVGVTNNNPDSYVSEVGLQLEDLSSPGYVFKGWKTSDGTQISEITANTTGNKTLYAQWEKVVYTINFDSPDVPVESMTYTIDTGATLISPSWYGYTFVGWSIDGKITSRIKPGTTGNITLHANWTSNRNRATAVSQLGTPSIIEDMDNGRYLFIYEIGTIENVPLAIIEEYTGNLPGITISGEYEYSTAVGQGFTNTIANTVSNATTKTSSWTLSEEWNESATATNEHDEEIGKTESKTDSEGNVVGGEYYISNSSGGSTAVSTSNGGSNSSSSKVTTSDSTGINGSYTQQSNKDTSVSIDVSASKSHTDTSESNWNINGELKYTPPKETGGVGGGVSGGGGHTWGDEDTTGGSISAGIDVTESDVKSATVSGYREKHVGTETSNNSSAYWDTSKSASSSWNTDNGYKNSSTVSIDQEISNIISQVIYDRYSYSSSSSRGENSSSTQSTSQNQTLTDEYSATIEYSTETQTTTTKTITFSSDAAGYYRLVTAGTMHVFAVVGYDFATNSYFTYTYSVLDEERHAYLDYSKDNANFNDCENAVLPFEIPYYVHEVISNVIARSEGLVVDPTTGYITEYNCPFAFIPESDTRANVVIPEYVSVDNGDGTYSAVRVRGIATDAFSGNCDITGIILPKYVSEIPEGAFEGCINLKTVIGYGITTIGANAFKGCENLTTFVIDEYITELGTNAFEGCPEIRAMAANSSVAEAILNSGAKKITLDLTKLSDSFDNRKIVVSDSTEYFSLFGGGKMFTNLQIESKAAETFISNITFVGNTDTPIKLNSDTITLGRVTVEEAPGFALIVESANAEVKLLGNINLSTKSTNAVISKDVTFSKMKAGTAGNMIVTGKYLVCGTITNEGMLTISNGIEYIDEDTFNSMLTSSTVTFNANSGSVSESSKTVYYGQYYGVLPTPTRANYTFAGWYTKAEGGTQITADSIVTVLVNQTLYAHWTPNTFTLYFDANGGSVSTSSKALTFGNSLGSLPTPTRANYTFAGWHDANGTRVYDSTVPGSATNFTVYAYWTPNTFNLYYNANGGYVSTSSKTLTFGNSFGSLPTPTRDYHNFIGWYDANGNRVYDYTVPNSATDLTIYAYWEAKGIVYWAKASDVPADAQIVDRKYTYTQTYYTTSSSSSLSGWTHYNTTSAWSDYGSWSGWSTSPAYGSDSRLVETRYIEPVYKTVWHYSRCISATTGGSSTYSLGYYGEKNNQYITLDYQLEVTGSNSGHLRYGPYVGDYGTYYKNYWWNEQSEQILVSEGYTEYRYCDRYLIYTYYFYRTENLESTSYPSGSNISNVQEWVCYRPK